MRFEILCKHSSRSFICIVIAITLIFATVGCSLVQKVTPASSTVRMAAAAKAQSSTLQNVTTGSPSFNAPASVGAIAQTRARTCNCLVAHTYSSTHTCPSAFTHPDAVTDAVTFDNRRTSARR